MVNIGYKYYFFGSKDSQDADVVIDHPYATGNDKDKELIRGLQLEHPEIKGWNINIIKIRNGQVVSTIPSKGSPDSVNNSLLETCPYHDQPHGLPKIQGRMERNKLLAIVKCYRDLLTAYKHGSLQDIYKEKFSKVLKDGVFAQWLETSREVPFPERPFNDRKKDADFFKRIAFRVGQTISLIEGVEVYSKDKHIQLHPEIAFLIKREPINNSKKLNEAITKLNSLIAGLPIQQHGKGIIGLNHWKVDMKHELPI